MYYQPKLNMNRFFKWIHLLAPNRSRLFHHFSWLKDVSLSLCLWNVCFLHHTLSIHYMRWIFTSRCQKYWSFFFFFPLSACLQLVWREKSDRVCMHVFLCRSINPFNTSTLHTCTLCLFGEGMLHSFVQSNYFCETERQMDVLMKAVLWND